MIDWKSLGLDEAAALYQGVGWRVRLAGAAVLLALGELVAIVVAAEGRAAMERLEHAQGALPRTLELRDGDGRRILLYKPRGHVSTTEGLHGTAPGVSLLSAGRDLALPPSRDGRQLVVWPKRGEPRELAELERVAELPDWLYRAAVDSVAARALWSSASKADAPGPLPCTDVGNAERLARAHGGDLRWVEAWGTWLAWDGRRWAKDDTGEVTRRAVDTVRQIGAEAATCEHEGQRKALLGHALKSESGRAIGSMTVLARAQAGLTARPDDLDADPWLLNTPSGVVDLRTGRLREHRRGDLCAKMAGAPFGPAATAPAFEHFLARVMPDPEVRAYLQRLAGCAASGEIREHVLPIHWGGGGNGKSVLTNAILHALGDYGSKVPTQVLLAKEHDAHPTERAVLRGLRFAACSETAQGRPLDEAQVKDLTGGERISARYMREDFFTFPPTHTLWLSTQNRPTIRETSNGIWRRVHLIPWTVEIPLEDQDVDLSIKLRDESSGVLRWIVEGCLAWQRQGLSPPQAVQVATQEYRAESDWLGDFLEARTTAGPKVLGGALFKAYLAWAERSGRKPVTQTAFGRAMGERKGVRGTVIAGYKWYCGIALSVDASESDGATSPDTAGAWDA